MFVNYKERDEEGFVKIDEMILSLKKPECCSNQFLKVDFMNSRLMTLSLHYQSIPLVYSFSLPSTIKPKKVNKKESENFEEIIKNLTDNCKIIKRESK